MHTQFGKALFFLLMILGVLISGMVHAAAPTYSVSLSGGSFSPKSICAGMSATATVSGTLNVNSPNQEYQESGDQWSWSASVTGYAATSSSPYVSVPSGVIPPIVSASSGSSSTTVTATAATNTSPGYYQITVSGTDTFNVTYNDGKDPPSTSPQSQSGSTTLFVTVVTVGGIQYKDPVNGWSSFSSSLYVLKGVNLQLKALPIPSDASFPSGKPVWGGTSGVSGTGATISSTCNNISPSASSPETITATCGGTVTGNVVVFDLIPQATPTDTSVPNHSPSLIGVGEVLSLSFSTNPSGITAGEIGNLAWTSSGSGTSNPGLSAGSGTYVAGATGGGVTLTLSITSGISSPASRTISKVIIAPTLGYEILSDGRTYHNQGTDSVGFYAYFAVNPNNVSFQYVEMRETDCKPSTATGFLAVYANTYHMGGANPVVSDFFPLTFSALQGAWESKPEYDQVGFNRPLDQTKYPPNGYGAGNVQWQIPWNFTVTNGPPNNSALINDVLQQGTTDTAGNATISKGGVSKTANVNDPYVGPFGPPPPNNLW